MKAILAAALTAFSTPIAAQAAIVIDVRRVGTSVVLKGPGTFNTNGLTLYGANLQGSPRINLAFGSMSVGASASINMFTGLTGPGLGYLQRSQLASSATGDVFGFAQYMSAINLPAGYQSGTRLSGSSTYLNATIAGLGLKDGQYVFRSLDDTLTLNIGSSAVPELAAWGMMIGGFAFAGGRFVAAAVEPCCAERNGSVAPPVSQPGGATRMLRLSLYLPPMEHFQVSRGHVRFRVIGRRC